MKKSASFLSLSLLTGALVFSAVPTSAYAADKINVEVSGSALQTEQDPFVHNGRTFVPLRSIFEALGATIDWNATTRTVTATKNDVTVKLTLGSNVAYRNDAPVELDAAPMVRDDRSYVPVRFIAESFNTPVKWDGATKTVRLLDSNRAKLEQILSTKAESDPFSFHLDYVGNYTQRKNGTGKIGTRTATIDLSYDRENRAYTYHGTWKQIGDLFRGVKDFDLYVNKENRAYVLFAGSSAWQTTTLEKAPNIKSSLLGRAVIPVLRIPSTFAKYAVLEETDTQNIITLYMTAQTYRQMQTENRQTPAPETMKKITLKYHINKTTNNWEKFEAWQTSNYADGMEFITYEIYNYSNIGKPYTLTLPQAAYQAQESNLSNLF